MKISIFCPHCHIHTALSMAHAAYSGPYGNTQHTPALWDNGHGMSYWIGICNYCQNPVLVKNNGEEIYPGPFPSPTDSRVPDPMKQDLIEAKLCFSIETYRACAVMARRTMQNACIDKGATKRDLVD